MVCPYCGRRWNQQDCRRWVLSEGLLLWSVLLLSLSLCSCVVKCLVRFCGSCCGSGSHWCACVMWCALFVCECWCSIVLIICNHRTVSGSHRTIGVFTSLMCCHIEMAHGFRNVDLTYIHNFRYATFVLSHLVWTCRCSTCPPRRKPG